MVRLSKVILIAFAVMLSVLAVDAQAQWRNSCSQWYCNSNGYGYTPKCGRSWQTLYSTRGWSTSCYTCHKVTDDSADATLNGVNAGVSQQYAFMPGLLNILNKRDKWVNDARVRADERMAFENAIDKLGLTGNFRWDAYGMAMSQGMYLDPAIAAAGQLSYQKLAQPFAAQGSTVMGYMPNQTASITASQIYGSIDVPAMINQAMRLADQTQNLSHDTTKDALGLVGDVSAIVDEGRRQVAEILAKGQVASQVLGAVNASPSQQQVRQFTFNATVGSNGQIQVTPQAPSGPQQQQAGQVGINANSPEHTAFVGQVIGTKCSMCHGGGATKGNFNMQNWQAFDENVWRDKVIARVTCADTAKRMPLANDGGPGQSLTVDEIVALSCWKARPANQ